MLMERPKDLKTWAYERIKHMIIHNSFNSSIPLKIEELSSQLGISRTPIREALLRLNCEGFVIVRDKIGFFVKTLSERDFEELFEMRELLEVFAVKQLIKNISDEEIKKFVEFDIASREALAAKSLTDFASREREFQLLIKINAENILLSNFIETLNELIHREKKLFSESSEDVIISVQEHSNIIQAIKERNTTKAAKAMKYHVQSVKERMRKIFDFNSNDKSVNFCN